MKQDALQAIAELTEEPYPFDCIPLEGYDGWYRIKFHRGRFRVVYQVVEKSRKVIITRIGSRDTVYRGLRQPRR